MDVVAERDRRLGLDRDEVRPARQEPAERPSAVFDDVGQVVRSRDAPTLEVLAGLPGS